MDNEYYEEIVENEIYEKSKIELEKRNSNTRGRKKKKNNMYFTLETENAIILYNKETDPIIRNKIYNEFLQYPIEKLVENIFNRFGFSYFDSHPEDVMAGAVSFILLNLNKFEEGKGKAFSYFSIVCKNYLIQINNKNHDKWKDKETLISAMPENWEVEDDYDIRERKTESNEFIGLMLEFWNKNVNVVFSKKRDIQIAYAIIQLFEKSDSLEFFNKKALYLYIREITGCKTTHITKVIKIMKDIVQEMLMEYMARGNIDMVKAKYGNVFWKGEAN